MQSDAVEARLPNGVMDKLQFTTVFVRAIATLIILEACLVFGGWLFDVPQLRTIVPGPVAMNPMTATAFLLAAAALAWRSWAEREIPCRATLACAALVLAIGLVKMLSFWGLDFDIDQWLFPRKLAAYTPINRMAPNTAAAFVVIGLALLLVDWEIGGRRPAQTHRDLAVAAMHAGLPVLSEKPLADTREAAADIVRVSQETGMLHMVAQNYRYSRPVQTLKRVLQSGQLGPIGAVTIHFFRGPHFGGFREAMPFPLIMDMSIHHFDMLRFFLDQDPVGVAGRSWNPAWSWFQGDAAASVVITFEAAVATYTGSWCAQGADTPWNGHWRFDCANGVALLEEDRVWTQRRGGERAEAPLVDLPLTAQPYLLHEFVTAITTGRQPATTCFDNIKSLQIVLDAIASFGRHGC